VETRYGVLVMAAKPSLERALEALKRDPTHPVRARVDDLTVELRAVTEPAAQVPGPVEGVAMGQTQKASLLGLMADDPDLVDQMYSMVYRAALE
jgi:hypothetical protein